MLILSQTLLFIILEVESGPVLTRPWLPKAMASSCVVSIAVYLKFQAFYGAFLFVYISTVVLIVGGSWRLAFTPKETAAAETARTELVKPLVLAGIAAYVCGGSVAWLLEMAFCEQVVAASFDARRGCPSTRRRRPSTRVEDFLRRGEARRASRTPRRSRRRVALAHRLRAADRPPDALAERLRVLLLDQVPRQQLHEAAGAGVVVCRGRLPRVPR